MKAVYSFLISTPLFIGLDLIWFKLISGDFFLERMRELVEVEEGRMVIDYSSALAVYVLLSLGIVLLVQPNTLPSKVSALGKGALFGFISYGIYDFTNHATLKSWSADLMLVDILWGSFSCAIVSLSLYTFSKRVTHS